jgi:hypothetical protein
MFCFFLLLGQVFFSVVGRKKNNNIIDGRQAGLGLARHIAVQAAAAIAAAAATGSHSRPFLAGSCSVLHGGSKKLKSAENKFILSDFTNFSKQVFDKFT